MQAIATYRSISLAVFAVFLLGVVGVSNAALAVTIVGTVSDGYQIVDEDGQPYEVENTVKGNELVLHHIGRKVEVTGTVKDEIDYKVIIVDSFRVLEE
jgi:hypothetical protein